MKKVISILVLAFGFSFADDFDMDGRMIPTFTIPKGDTNFNTNRQSEVKKITFNDSTIVIEKKGQSPKFEVCKVYNHFNNTKMNYGME